MKIIDVIKHKNKYSTQTFIVLDKMPDFKYERVGNNLIGEDSGFYNFYGYRNSRDAFGGREFDIPMLDGGIEKAFGQWWDCMPEDYRELVGAFGIGTPEKLGEYNVFSSACVDMDIITEWLKENEPSNNYEKYKKGGEFFGVNTIVSRFD